MKNLKKFTITSIIMVLCLMIISCEKPYNVPTDLPRNNNTNFIVSLSASQTNAYPINYAPFTIQVEIQGESNLNTSPTVVLKASHLLDPEKSYCEGNFLLSYSNGDTLYGSYTGEGINPFSHMIIKGGTGKHENASGLLSVDVRGYNPVDPFTMTLSGYVNTGDISD
ncbi:MAG: hypothetical protein OEW67_15265 [Cyclobacteriaceae bacterium]|nr:hypothetical protein [Cyclobacteriaceae bacterium]